MCMCMEDEGWHKQNELEKSRVYRPWLAEGYRDAGVGDLCTKCVLLTKVVHRSRRCWLLQIKLLGYGWFASMTLA